MQAKNTSAVFGLNWLQDMETVEIQGAYDSDKEIWINSGPAKAANSQLTTSNPTMFPTGIHTFHNGQSDSDESPDSCPDCMFD
jgi:hypothetical protein